MTNLPLEEEKERPSPENNFENTGFRHHTAKDSNWVIPQDWEKYTQKEHKVWETLYKRQVKSLKGLACDEFIKGIGLINLGNEKIPDIRRVNEKLYALTGWIIVAVPSLIPDDIFFQHLANRRFPAGQFIRKPEELNYLQEPDIFHDIFGHVPLLTQPVFADYMQAYGKGGLKAITFNRLKNLSRLYWYTVEFGLINKPEGLRIYGAGIASSHTESTFSIYDTSPNRIHFDLKRIMKTDYRIDDFQQTYFIIDSFEKLLQETQQNFATIYPNIDIEPQYAYDEITSRDKVYHKGTQKYAHSRK